jgi:hypothetical protein
MAAIARGPRSARPPRKTMLRKVVLEHDGELYNATIRNISQSGALVEGLWNVPPETVFRIHLGQDYAVEASSRWAKDDRMGMEFAAPLPLDASGAVVLQPPARRVRQGEETIPLLKAG